MTAKAWKAQYGGFEGLPAKISIPHWWPHDSDRTPCSKLYRICRVDMEDFVYKEHPAMTNAHGTHEFMRCVLDAVAHGSLLRTDQINPFWHASTQLSCARNWRFMADDAEKKSLGHKWIGDQPTRVAIKINILEWYQSGTMPEHGLIDLSSEKAQKRALNCEFHGFPQDEALKATRYAIRDREVLIKWRGAVPAK